MKGSRVVLCVGFLLTTLAIGCTAQAPSAPAAEQQAAPAATSPAAPAADRQAEAGTFPNRDFTRMNLDKLEWRATETTAWRADRHSRRRSFKDRFLSHD